MIQERDWLDAYHLELMDSIRDERYEPDGSQSLQRSQPSAVLEGAVFE